MKFFQCTLTFVRGAPKSFVCDVRACDADQAKRFARIKAKESGFTEVVKLIKARELSE